MATLKVDGFDLWTYTRIAPGEGLDISDSDFIEPQFGDSGLGFGDQLISVHNRNREIVIPIHLRSDTTTKDGLHVKVSDLNRRLAVAKQFEYRDDNASASTFFDIRFARFEPEFNKRRQDALWMTGFVRIYTEPFGKGVSSGYSFTTGSYAGTGVSASISLASRITGDAPMTVKFELNTPSLLSPLSHGRIAVGAILPASYVSDWAAASILPGPYSVLVGASGVAASQILCHAPNAGAFVDGSNPSYYTGGVVGRVVITCASAYAGNNRVLAVVNSEYDIPIAITRMDGLRYAVATVPDVQGLGTVDLGVEFIDPRKGATHTIQIQSGITNRTYQTPASNPTSPLAINRLILVPEDSSVFIVDDSRRRLLADLSGNPARSGSSGFVPTVPIILDDVGNRVSATNAYMTTVASTAFRYGDAVAAPAQIYYNGSITGPAVPTAKAEFNATAYDISGYMMAALMNGGSGAMLSLGKHTRAGDWFVQYAQRNPTTAWFTIGWNSTSVASFMSVSTIAVSNVDSYAGFLRMTQQGPVMHGELQMFRPWTVGGATGGGRFGNTVFVASISASVGAGLAVEGTPIISGVGIPFSRVTFTGVPSYGRTAGDTYSSSGDELLLLQSSATSVQDIGWAMRGGFVSISPDASKYNAAVVYNLPLDRSGGLGAAWSARVSINERFTYSK